MTTSPSGTSQSSLPPALIAAEQRVREFLAQAKWRKARDEVKPLVKADRPRYLPLLIQANLGLVREMMAKGQFSEAQQVLRYLTTIAPADQLRAVELELAGKSRAADAALPQFVAALADTGATLAEAERVRLADVLMLAWQSVPAQGPAQEELTAELRAAQDALQAASYGQWEQATTALRAIPHRSAFSHWVLFIKGLVAFHRGETERMEKCFAALPPDSAPTKTAQVYRLLAGRLPAAPAGQALPEALIEAACRLVGTPGVGRLLWRADQAWTEGRYADSYRVFRDALRVFPSHGLDWLGVLSQFYFHAPHAMSEAERSGYLRYFDGLISRRQFKSGIEEMWTRRMFALVDCAIMPAWNLRHDWECYLRQYQVLRGENPRLASLAYGWLGEQLAMARVSHALFAPRQPQLRDASGAVEVLQKSIQLDPGNRAAHLQLCAVYDALRQTSERNRLLDDMTARFPDDKQVLLRAAQGCIERKAFVKGLGYLDRVQQIDPLDPLVPELVATAQRRQARQYFQQRKPEKARETLAHTEAYLTDKPDNLQRSRWTALVRHGLMELLWGDAARSQELLNQARAHAPSLDACLFFSHLAHRVYTKTRRCQSPFWTDYNQASRAAPSIGAVARLLRILDYWKQSPEEPYVHEEEIQVSKLIKPALQRAFSRAEALEVMERAQGSFVFEDQVNALVKRMLRDDPLDPRVRLFQIGHSGGWEFNPTAQRAKLQSILDEAVRRQEDPVVRQVRQMLRQLDHPPLPPPAPFGEDLAIPYDGEEEDEEFDEPLAPEGPLPPNLTPAQLAQFEGIIEVLRNATDSEVRKLRKSRPPEIPEFVFDAVVQMARGGPPPPLPPDPNQLNLF